MVEQSIMHKISVVMPVHNAEGYFKTVLESVLNQTLPDFELIIIDDCSTDSTVALIESYIVQDSRIKIIKMTDNLGAGASRNIGIEHATGKYIIFLDDDDVIESNMFELLFFTSESLELDVLCFRTHFIDYNTQKITETPWTIRSDLLPPQTVFSGRDIKSDFFRAFIWWPWDKLFKRDFIISTGVMFQEIRTSNDLAFTATQVLLAGKISVLDQVLISHTVARNGSLENSRNSSYACAIDALKQLKKNLEDAGLFTEKRCDYVSYCVSFLEWNANTLHGDSYFNFYSLCKAFLEALEIKDSELIEPNLVHIYHDLITLDSINYLFKLKGDLQRNLNYANGEIESLRLIESNFNEVQRSSECLSKQLQEARDKYSVVEELLSNLTNELSVKRRELFGHENSTPTSSDVSHLFSQESDFDNFLNEKECHVSEVDKGYFKHLKDEFKNMLRILAIYRERVIYLEQKINKQRY
ncbi:glycosyltransferase family 2 protein [Candidatus Pantoea multigeneris]|uniref:Glycosyltransferase family 2 protein n=1 Tax=Candidatus Pantoea multigeneris TaxID=2608357 RepID=A0ABX0RJH2_9GAMM|nr:glycosyltransferase family 2 protein [Pantoea multigeneris]NIF24617.1 glycosyltransferase family 2 protein [Pantoea multigeneris]